MAFTLSVEIVSAEAGLYSSPALRVVVPCEMGEICVYPYHAPLLARLKSGLIRIQESPDREEDFFVSSGFVEVQPFVVTVLADTVIRSSELDLEAATRAKSRAEEALRQAVSPEQYDRVKAELGLQLSLIRAIDQLKERKR